MQTSQNTKNKADSWQSYHMSEPLKHMHVHKRMPHILGDYNHQAKRFKHWQKILFTPEHFSSALSVITSESGLCLTWKSTSKHLPGCVFVRPVFYKHMLST